MEEQAPLLLKILSGIYFWGFGNLFAIGQFLTLLSAYLLITLESLASDPIVGLALASFPITEKLVLVLIAGIFVMLFGVFCFFEGLGLWNGHQWARILGIVVGCLIGLVAVVYIALNITKEIKSIFLLSLMFGVFILNVFYVSYLLLSTKAKEYFNS